MYYVDVLVNFYIGRPVKSFDQDVGSRAARKELDVVNIVPQAVVVKHVKDHSINSREREQLIADALTKAMKLLLISLKNLNQEFVRQNAITFGVVERATFNPERNGLKKIKIFDRQFPPILSATLMEKSQYKFSNVGYFKNANAEGCNKGSDWNTYAQAKVVEVFRSTGNKDGRNKVELFFKIPNYLLGIYVSAGGRRIDKQTVSDTMFGYKYWVTVTVQDCMGFNKPQVIELSKFRNDIVPTRELEKFGPELMAHNIITEILSQMPTKIFQYVN